MRKAIVPAFLLVLGSVVLGATVLRDPLARAANPFTDVIVGNTASNPVPVSEQDVDANGNLKVHEQGTANVTGTVGLAPADSSALSTAAARLTSIDASTSKLAPTPVHELCFDNGLSIWDLVNTDTWGSICSGSFTITDITTAGMDDALELQFKLDGNVVLDLFGGGAGGIGGSGDGYQMDLAAHPLRADDVEARCYNFSTHCHFLLALLGTSS